MENDIPRLTPEQFAILPWGWTPAAPQVLADIYACGFNLAGFIPPDGLDAVQAAGLKAIAFEQGQHVSDEAAQWEDARVAAQVQSLVDRVKGHPALYGYYLRDEPGAVSFAGLGRWSRAYRQADPQALPYINLFPNYATPQQMGVETYAQYVDSFLDLVSPPFVSYDHYALMQDGSLRGLYFENLEIVRAAALRQGIPFWNIVLSNSHFEYAEPSMAGLLFQAYTTLAYGARGISYFTYFAPDVGNYRLAPIDQFGEKTPTWSLLRLVNYQIHRLGPTYLGLKSVNVFHTPDLPSGTQGVETSRFLDAVGGGTFVVGEFESAAGQPSILVVNKDLQRATAFTLQPKKAVHLLRTSPYSGQTAPVGGEDLWLSPGQGMLLTLEE